MSYVSVAKAQSGEEEGRVVFTPSERDPRFGTLQVTGTQRFTRSFDRICDTPGRVYVANWSFEAPLQRNTWEHVQAAIHGVSESYEWGLSWELSGIPAPTPLPDGAVA